MPLSKEHKSKTREKIVNAAADLFRQKGYDGVGIDTIMASANLTRGGFYAHFKSKAELFSEVVKTKHDLIKRLSERPSDSETNLRNLGAEIYQQYLNPDNFQKVAPNCTLSTLSMDVYRTDPNGRAEYTDAINRLLTEIAREPSNDNAPISAKDINISTLAIGALSLARAVDDEKLRNRILHAASAQISDWFSDVES